MEGREAKEEMDENDFEIPRQQKKLFNLETVFQGHMFSCLSETEPCGEADQQAYSVTDQNSLWSVVQRVLFLLGRAYSEDILLLVSSLSRDVSCWQDMLPLVEMTCCHVLE